MEERGRREEITASKDEGFARYQAKLDEMHCAFFAEPLAHPEQTAERIRAGFWDSPSADPAPLAPSRQGIPCMHLKVSDFPYHKDEDAKAGVVEHIEAWLTKNRLTW